MNYAVLHKVRAISISRDELIEAGKNILARKRITDLVETAVYLSPTDPQEFYCLYFFWNLPQLENLSPIFYFETPEWEMRRQLLEQDVFKLIWEKRLLTATPAASHLRLMIFPASRPQEEIYRQIAYNRDHKNGLPDLMGAWVGRWINQGRDTDKIKVLSRSDWSSLEAQQAYFDSTYGKFIQQDLGKDGIRYELASFDLRGIVHPTLTD